MYFCPRYLKLFVFCRGPHLTYLSVLSTMHFFRACVYKGSLIRQRSCTCVCTTVGLNLMVKHELWCFNSWQGIQLDAVLGTVLISAINCFFVPSTKNLILRLGTGIGVFITQGYCSFFKVLKWSVRHLLLFISSNCRSTQHCIKIFSVCFRILGKMYALGVAVKPFR